MKFPEEGDYIDIHTHGAKPVSGIFFVDNLMVQEERLPETSPGIAYSAGIHPWYLNGLNYNKLIISVKKLSTDPSVIAIGEAGFDRLKGPSAILQRKAFEEQVLLAEEHRKPIVIHCVRAWDEILMAHKKLKPKMNWLVHGFRGTPELAMQLISRGMYLSFWYDFIVKPESSKLIRGLPAKRIFLETDGADVDIRDLYNKVSVDLEISVDELKSNIYSNFKVFFASGDSPDGGLDKPASGD